MKALVCAIGLAVGCSLAAAQATAPGTGNAAGTGATTGTTGASTAKEYWSQHSNGGYMTKDDAMTFKGPDDSKVDMQKLDTDNDGRVSEQEWRSYNQMGTTK